MLFNSPEFIFLFLPITALLFFLLRRFSILISLIWLTFASLFFYGYWNPHYLYLLIASILFNYFIGHSILLLNQKLHFKLSKTTLIFGIISDLALLGYYKYTDFFITIANHTTHSQYSLLNVILPLGISFFTFTQIAYLVDCFRNEVKEYSLIKYTLFVTYFPHLIAGPILHHKEMIPQFNDKTMEKLYRNFIPGLVMFTIGLCKKIYFADGIAGISNKIFSAAQTADISTIDAWMGALAYTLQIYFDFSGYSDMAIGISFLFGVRLPINFYSPYKSINIIEFWRRWHMTLSRFLRDYLYIPLGGNRKGPYRRYINLITTMVLGGLWHGAGWTFLIWGALHGCYLSINHAWQFVRKKFCLTVSGHLFQLMSTMITFICVTLAWVFFRAPDVKTAFTFIHSMLAIQTQTPQTQIVLFSNELLIGLLLTITWFLPNSLQITHQVDMVIKNSNIINTSNNVVRWFHWRISPIWGILTGTGFAAALLGVLAIGDGAEFLYFQF